MRRWHVGTLAVVAALVIPQGAHAFVPLGEQFRISFMGPNGTTESRPEFPSAAYNPAADEYLVVWQSDDNTPPLVDNEFEIWAQRLSPAGTPLGGRIRVSAQGADGDPNSEARTPSVAYSPTANEYLVVWQGEVGTTGEFEISGRRLSAAGEKLGGSDDLRLSDMGPDGDADYGAGKPSAVFNPVAGEYLVVWEGDDNTEFTPGVPLVDNELEIFGQRLTAAGAEEGGDFRISEQGADGMAATGATEPSVAYNPTTNEYLVAWSGEDGISDEGEIWAQRLSATGGEVGGSDFRISDMGPDGNANYDAFRASVAANPAGGGYLVVWQGDDDSGFLDENEFEVFSQRLNAGGSQIGANDFRISEMGPDGDENHAAVNPSVVATANEYLVVWHGANVSIDEEIFGQRLPATGADAVEDDVRISFMGPESDPLANGRDPGVAYNATANEYLAVWWGNTNTPPLARGEFEIFGRRLGDPPPPAGGGGTPGGGNGGGGTGSTLQAFGAETLVTLALAVRRIPADGPLKVRVTNRNGFAVAGRLSGRTTRPVSGARRRRIRLKAKSFNVGANAKRTVSLRLPRALRRSLKHNGRLSLRLTASVNDPAGNTRVVNKKVTPKLKPRRRR
jgi:hypothetical protein